MKGKIAICALAAAVVMPQVAPAPAMAQTYQGYDEGRQQGQYPADDRYYRGRDASYYEHCHRSSGTTGLLAGGAGGAVLAGVLGASPIGIIASGLGGALLGKHLDKRHDSAQNDRNGC